MLHSGEWSLPRYCNLILQRKTSLPDSLERGEAGLLVCFGGGLRAIKVLLPDTEEDARLVSLLVGQGSQGSFIMLCSMQFVLEGGTQLPYLVSYTYRQTVTDSRTVQAAMCYATQRFGCASAKTEKNQQATAPVAADCWNVAHASPCKHASGSRGQSEG